ncbi:negative elongation factor B-like [Haliotis rubra]|uniref:negative elongation factor B-like n=1 Tax=Haliotis rubra TaxID=36100 RepID=UPI001EE50C37|nr:negative elongation factor B-like [Haliotis rubra]
MSGLDALGIPGGEALREALTNCSDPLGAIEEFQSENGVLLPSLRPALPFLDLHGVRRLEFHESILEELREKLVNGISDLANSNREDKIKKLEELLVKSFPVIKVKTVRPVVMNILKHLPQIKEEYLTQILDDKELYTEAATEVKRQIWQDNQALFGDEVSPLLQQYIAEKENSLLSHENSALSFFLPMPKVRRQSEVVQKLVHMIGKNVKLYDMVLQFLRTLFLRTRNTHYCTLRAELLMAIHDLEVNEICSVDPCHKFTWCVDACIRERIVNTNRSRELQGFLDGIKKGQEFVLGDLSMILCDPYALNTIAQSAMKVLLYCVSSETLPRENHDLQLLVRMIALGLGAWNMIDNQVFREPKQESQLFTKFIPCIVGMVVDDQIRAVSTKLEEGSCGIRPPSELYSICIKLSPIASLFAMYYALHVARYKDRVAVTQILPTLIHCENDRAYDDIFLHSLISHLIHMVDDFAMSEEFCSAVFDDFLLVGLSKENVLRHMLRLLWHIHHRLSQTRLENLMETVHPNNELSEAVRTTYQQLSEKINTYSPSPVAQPEKLDSPLMSVPAPTPAVPDRM